MTRDAGDDLDDGLEYDIDFTEDVASETVETEQDSSVLDEAANESGAKKRKAPSSKLQQKKKLKMEMDIKQKKDLSLELSPEAISEYVNSKIRNKNPDLSALELSELYLEKTVFRATGDFKDPRSLDNLSAFITAKFKNMLPSKENDKKKNKKNNKKNKNNKEDPEKVKQPQDEERKFVALLSMSAIRACDVHRATRELPGSSLKLINKNKIDVDLKLVKTTHSRVLCCTPGRLEKVLTTENSGLNSDEIKIVILDNSYLDQKLQNIWDIKETLTVLKKLTDSGSKIYLY